MNFKSFCNKKKYLSDKRIVGIGFQNRKTALNWLTGRLRQAMYIFNITSCFVCWLSSTAQAETSETNLPLARTVVELRNEVTREQGRICAYNLKGLVLAISSNSKTLFFQDDSGTEILQADLTRKNLQAGQIIQISGTNYVSYSDIGLSLGTAPMVDADNLHSKIERFGTVHLKAGQHPIRVTWFNKWGEYFFSLEYSGPQLTRQVIPPSVLSHLADNSEDKLALPGLFYRCFEGKWDKLPDFDDLVPQKTGIVSYFTESVETRMDDVGLEFKGFLQIPEDGDYTFYLSSDDGSQLFLDDSPPIIDILRTAVVPAPGPIAVSQPLLAEQNCLWASTEGTITFMSRDKNHLIFELASGGNQMQVEVLDALTQIPWHLLNSHVRVRGICPDMKNIAGQKYAGSIMVADWEDLSVLDVAPSQWLAFQKATIGELTKKIPVSSNGIVFLRGHLYFDPTTHMWRFEDETGSAPVKLLNGLPVETNSIVECLSQWNSEGTNILLHQAFAREYVNELDEKTNTLRVLTTAMQVQGLTREEAERGYPVEIQGVVTRVSDDFESLIIQDASRAVFVWVGDKSPESLPKIGDYCKLEGVSRSADFSPVVNLRKATILWKGQMPQPIIPTRDQLFSGSLDAQYIEIRGLVTEVHTDYITLLTADGILNLNILPAPSERWENFLNSIIRVRGCLLANWNADTHRVVLDQPLNIRAATVSVDSASPPDLFKADKMRAKDLMEFDARFDTFRRVKVRGQIVHGSSDRYYLMDGATGLRVQLVQPMQFDFGDEVEVVGLVELGGASPMLYQAVARKMRHLPLPEPRQLSLDSLSNNYDSTLVSVTGTLVGLQNHGSEQILEMQVGVKNFIARLDSKSREPISLAVGSRLKLTGVFSALNGSTLAGRDVNSFELLLNSPADVQVIARPAWWTLNRLLAAVTGLLTGLVLAFAWITLLRRQVERRTRQLHYEISERETAEKLRAIEHERTRIARDLHDDLGSGITEINMMATTIPGSKIEASAAIERLRQIVEKSRFMISSLDGVVWVINPQNDKLTSLIEYLASYAEEFLAKAEIACRVKLPDIYSDRIIKAEMRHDVLLAVRETLNNAVRHGRPSKVLLQISVLADYFEILISDNGRGFDLDQAMGNGLDNLQQRMNKWGGSCRIQTISGSGASVVLKLSWPK
jgi:signal transduction histidine kinase